MSNVINVETDGNAVILSGDINLILEHRRANRILKDTLDCMIFDERIIINSNGDFQHILDRVNYLAQMCNYEVSYTNTTDTALSNYLLEEKKFKEFSQKALSIRNNECKMHDLISFENALIDYMPNRTLYDLQLLAAYHLAFSQNACNFSVPGAGKTSVVYGAYAYLKNLPKGDMKKVDRLLIIGPLSSFAPWELEYNECFGVKPVSKRLTGQMSIDSKKQYLFESEPAEITLLSYPSVSSLIEEIGYFLRKNRVMVVLDEAHKIKNINGGIYAESVLSIAPKCMARVVLTGTPAPNGYEDLYNLFKFIWPKKKIIKFQPGQLRDMSKNNDDVRVETLIKQISPYFVRVKKSDLNIPKAIIHPPLIVKMKDSQRKIYDYIEKRSMEDIVDSKSKLFKNSLVKARMIRLMQAASNPALLKQPLSSFAREEGLDLKDFDDNSLIGSILKSYNDEVPSKFEKAFELANDIVSKGGKVVIWACYIKTIEDLSEYFTSKNLKNEMLYGSTPIATDFISIESDEYDSTREAIVERFNDLSSGLNVIIANPFAVAESISLHKACHNAIYIERTFNAAHFIQSKDRIHRYGLPEDTITNYYYILSEDSIDETINDRLEFKEHRLIEIMESMPIPLFSNVLEDDGNKDVKAVLKDYARRVKTI